MKLKDLKEGQIGSYQDGRVFYRFNNDRLEASHNLESQNPWVPSTLAYNDIFKLEVEPYVPKIDWTKVPIDTPILVRDERFNEKWKRRYFAGLDGNSFLAFHHGSNSWSNNGEHPTRWKMATTDLTLEGK